jgi:hypothetical protein
MEHIDDEMIITVSVLLEQTMEVMTKIMVTLPCPGLPEKSMNLKVSKTLTYAV